MLPAFLIEPVVRAALAEDCARGADVTASLLGDRVGELWFTAREDGVLSGLEPARLAFALTDPAISFEPIGAEAGVLRRGVAFARVAGLARNLVIAERTALNFLTHLSGVATLTRRFVDAVAGTGAKIAATRKTLPGLRALQKAAVMAGGGLPHRFGLDDAVLVKDNHIALAGSLATAIRRARAAAGHMRKVEVEIDRIEDLEEALAHGPDLILLDNFTVEQLKEAVALAAGRIPLEASGGVTLESVRAIAETGVSVISVGALTHSAPALDIGLDAVPPGRAAPRAAKDSPPPAGAVRVSGSEL